jgi:hypothetical protein
LWEFRWAVYKTSMHTPSRALAAAAFVLLAASHLPAQTLYGIGDLPGGINWSQVRDVAKTGGTIYAVGSSAANTGSPGGDTMVLWTSTGGLTAIPNLATNTTGTIFVTASDITPDAAYIAGRARNAPTGNVRQAVRITTSGLVLTDLGNPAGFTPNSYGLATSDDGSVVYGISTNGSSAQQATRFEVGVGATAINFASVGDTWSFPTARAISGNGNLMLGTSATNSNLGGPGARAFLYDYNGGASTVSLLPLLSGGSWNQGLAMNATGSLMLVGGDSAGNANGDLYLVNSSNAITALGTPNAGFGLNAFAAMSGDGSVVGITMTDVTNGHSYIHNTNGWQSFYGVAAASGANLTGWTTLNINGISEDGTLVWGDGLHNGNNEGYVLEFAGGYLATAVAIPEPATYAMLAGVVAFGLAAWRRRAQRGA